MRRVRLGCGLVVVAVGLALCGALATHMGQYLLWQGVYQAKLLWGAMPTEQAIKQGYLTEAERDKLVMVERIRAFGQRIGLKPSDSYRTIHPTWDVTLYNVSACNPVAFESVTWWFPIVGTVPYLGFFREQDARQTADELRAQGLDV